MKKVHNITIKTPDEIIIMAEAGKILAGIVQEVKSSLKSGMKTIELDAQAEEIIKKHNVIPAFKGYRGFPGCVCVSVNEEVVHGIPSDRVVQEGDIVSVDVGIIYKDYYSDTASTMAVGEITPELQNLLDVTEGSLFKGIEKVKSGNHLSDISHAIQNYVEEHELSIVREFVGHGIGKNLHEDPEIPNYGPPHDGPVLEAGMVFAIEPMVNMGTWKTKILEDGWTVVTEDEKPSAHFEHCVVVTNEGPQVITKL